MTESKNPCLVCNIDQDCCNRLTGLKLTAAEFTRNFAHHQTKLTVEKIGDIYQVSAKDGGQCPNWQGQCSVYGTRPVECRLFPHTIGQVVQCDDHVLLTFHSRTTCPLKHDLIMSEVDAEKMVRAFAEDAYGKNRRVRIVKESGLAFIAAMARRIATRTRSSIQ